MGLIWKRNGTSAVVVGKASGSTLTGGEAASSSNVYDWLEVEQDTTRSGTGTTSSEYSIRAVNVRKFAVGWGDGQSDELISGFDVVYDPLHSYASSGTYSVRYLLKKYPGQTSTLSLKYAAAQNSAAKHTDVKRWGGVNLDYESISYYFGSSAVTTLTATDLPPSVCTNWLGAFNSAPAFAGGNLANWTHIPFEGTEYMFTGTIFNEDISGWNMTTHEADLDAMFSSDSAFNQDISSWSFPTPTGTRTMVQVFNNADAFNHPLAGWNTSKTTTFYRCFFGCALFNQDLGSWDVSSATNIAGMFQSTNAFNNGGVSTVGTGLDTWNVSNVTDFNSMFRSAAAFNSYLGSWTLTTDPAKDVNMSLMFLGCSVLNQDFSGWNTERVTTMALLFRACNVFNNNGVGGVGAGLDSWDTSSVTSINQMFWQSPAFNQTVGSWDMSSCTDFSLAFSAASFNNGGVGGVGVGMDNWNVSAGTNFSEMFRGSAFNQYIGSWNMGAATNISNMFNGCTSFTGGGVGNWTFSVLSTCGYFVAGATLFNTSIDWDMRTVGNLADLFYSAPSFNGGLAAGVSGNNVLIQTPTGGTWSGGFLFGDCVNFNQDVSTQGIYWDMSLCNDLSAMFRNALYFNQNISNWNTGNVTSMANMFQSAGNVFNQDISGWSIASLTDANNAFLGAAISRTNYDLMLDNTTGWASQATIQSGVALGMGTSQYTLGGAAEAGRNVLTGTYGWTITDGGGV